MIDLHQVSKHYLHTNGQPFVAVAPTDLHIKAGEIFGLIGYSGAGKSTLLRLMNLLERPDSGQVIVDGQNLTDLSLPALRQARQGIGMVFQQFNLLSNLTVAQNVAQPLKIARWSPALIDARVAECLAIVGLSDRAQHYPAQLSGGQKQRVGIARALAPKPKVILADEPTSALDPQTTQTILSCLRTINEQFNVTIVIVTHDMPVIRSLCHRAALCDAGKIHEIFTINQGQVSAQSDLAKHLLNLSH